MGAGTGPTRKIGWCPQDAALYERLADCPTARQSSNPRATHFDSIMACRVTTHR
jgi:hypothetical protein